MLKKIQENRVKKFKRYCVKKLKCFFSNVARNISVKKFQNSVLNTSDTSDKCNVTNYHLKMELYKKSEINFL